jgi:MoaA/NifB/PqqE/SkfB family radical SAM enzyme
LLDRVIDFCCDNSRRIKVKITGGEPLLRNLWPILNIANRSDVEFVGLGTNGTIRLPEYFNMLHIPTNVYSSIHTLDELSGKGKLTLNDFRRDVDNPHIKFRLSCNLIRGQIDSVESVTEYLESCHRDIDFVCFRELNSISLDESSIYGRFVYDYVDYREKYFVSIGKILSCLNSDWEYIKEDNFGFISNIYYEYKNRIMVMFRILDEQIMLEIADKELHIINEVVIHPDGLITGCWDRDRKVIDIGGVGDALQAICAKTN